MKNVPRTLWFYLGAAYLLIQSLAALLWWFLLVVAPDIRPYFRPSATPDSALFAFFLPDLILFIGAALVSAKRLVSEPKSARVTLLLHVGGATYAAMYCVAQTLVTGEAILATLFMLPPVFMGSAILWLIGRE